MSQSNTPGTGGAGNGDEHLCSSSPEETQALGARLAKHLRPGDVVAFTGDLGTGKTCMIQGLCAALGVTDPVNSPTFVLINQYEGRWLTASESGDQASAVTVYHFDWYRLAGADELLDIGADEIMAGEGLSLVEWAERGTAVLPWPRWEVDLAHAGDGVRNIRCRYRTEPDGAGPDR